MSIEFHCPHCSQLLRVPEGSQGKKCECPGCQTLLTIPSPTPPPSAADVMLEVPCPKCSHILVCDASLQGTRGMCKNCKHVFTIGKSSKSPATQEVFAFACPFCNALFEGNPEMEYRKGKCTSCQQVFIIERMKSAPASPQPLASPPSKQPSSASVPKSPSPPAARPVSHPSKPAPSPPTPKPQTVKAPTQRPSQAPPPLLAPQPLTETPPSVFDTLGNDFSAAPSVPSPSMSGSAASANWNPYQATAQTSFQTTTADSADEAIRRQHLSHEAGIRSFGILFGIGAVLYLFLGIVTLIFGVVMLFSPQRGAGAAAIVTLILPIIYVPLGLVQGFVAIGLRKLNNVGRIGGTVFGAIGLLGIPIGTLISAYLLYLLWSAKANMVFSPEYQRIRRATPHIKYKTSIVTWIVLGLLILFIIFLFAMILLK